MTPCESATQLACVAPQVVRRHVGQPGRAGGSQESAAEAVVALLPLAGVRLAAGEDERVRSLGQRRQMLAEQLNDERRHSEFPPLVVLRSDEDARGIAFAFLADRIDKIRTGEWVITGVQEHETAWSVSYQSRAFIESGNISDTLVGNGPVVVPKFAANPWLS